MHIVPCSDGSWCEILPACGGVKPLACCETQAVHARDWRSSQLPVPSSPGYSIQLHTQTRCGPSFVVGKYGFQALLHHVP